MGLSASPRAFQASRAGFPRAWLAGRDSQTSRAGSPGLVRPSSAGGQAVCPQRPTFRLRLAHHLTSVAGRRRGPDRAQAVGGWGRDAAGAALALPTERAAMRVRGPRLEIELRVIRRVAEEVVDELQPGAQAGLGRQEHMFETLGGPSDGMGGRLQGESGRFITPSGERLERSITSVGGRIWAGGWAADESPGRRTRQEAPVLPSSGSARPARPARADNSHLRSRPCQTVNVAHARSAAVRALALQCQVLHVPILIVPPATPASPPTPFSRCRLPTRC
jgi:hypothetical protein